VLNSRIKLQFLTLKNFLCKISDWIFLKLSSNNFVPIYCKTGTSERKKFDLFTKKKISKEILVILHCFSKQENLTEQKLSNEYILIQ